jgi:WhiB family redox-sensing transcriptional regulator
MNTRAPDTLQPADTWRDRAACAGAPDADLWHPDGTTGPFLDRIAEAKTICSTCPVMYRCLAWAIETGQEHGVWGGATEAERQSIRRTRGQQNRARDLEPIDPACREINRLAQQEKANDARKAAAS